MATPDCTARAVYIYALCEPDQAWNVRYVGRTVRPLAERLQGHLQKSSQRNTYKCHWIACLAKRGLRPTIRLLDIATDETWDTIEQFYISTYSNAGFLLTNGTLGGDGIPSGSLAWSIIGHKISAAHKGRKPWNTGRTASQETKAKMSTTRKGKKLVILNSKNRNKTHCPQGHEYNGENTRYRSDGSRQCVACQNERNKAWSEQYAGKRPWGSPVDLSPVLCACGCGTWILPFDSRSRPRRFKQGHNGRINPLAPL